MRPTRKPKHEETKHAQTASDVTEGWVAVQQVPGEAEAAILVGFLESEGIPAGAYDRSSHQTPAQNQELMSIDIAVPASRFAEAEEVLQERGREFDALPQDGESLVASSSPPIQTQPDFATELPEETHFRTGVEREHARLVEDRIDDARETTSQAEEEALSPASVEAYTALPSRDLGSLAGKKLMAVGLVAFGAGLAIGLLAGRRR
jgi:hypothetical protein